MTVISAMKFNDKEAAIVADEQITYGWRKQKLSTKLKEYNINGTKAVVGITGTYDVLLEVVNFINDMPGNSRDGITNSEELADVLAHTMNAVNHRIIDGVCHALWGISEHDIISGEYEEETKRSGGKREINPLIHRQYHDLIRGNLPESDWIRGGLLLLSQDAQGLNMYNIDSSVGTWTLEPKPYQTVGSGSDSADLVLKQFYERIPWSQRNAIEPVDGLAALINATDRACVDNIGVEGTPLIRIMHPQRGIVEPNESNSRLAIEIVRGERKELLPTNFRRSALGALLYEDADSNEIEKMMWDAAGRNKKRLDHLLRNYRM